MAVFLVNTSGSVTRRMWQLWQSRSLFWRVLFLFLLIVLVAVVTMGLSTNWLAQHELENPTAQNKTQTANAQRLATVLDIAFHHHQSTEQIQSLVEHLAQGFGTHVLLVNQEQRVTADSLRAFLGLTLIEGTLAHPVTSELHCSLLLKRSNLPVLLAYQGRVPPCAAPFTILSLAGDAWTSPLGVTGHVPSSFNRVVIASANDILLLAMLIGGLTAFLLAVFFTWTMLTPLKALTRAAYQMEQGDLTQRVTMKAGGELATLGAAFNIMAASQQRAEHLRRSLVNDIAHELRTPLATIQANLDALQDGLIEPTQERIASLQEESLLLGRLIADLQELSLAEAGHLALKIEPIALSDCIATAVQHIQLSMIDKHLNLLLDLPADLPQVEADATRLGQILRNLLYNAIRHTPAGGTITIGAKADTRAIRVSIQDTGEGIAVSHLPYVFERFYRVDTSRSRQTGGTGLGLAIVKQLVQAHGGQVTVESSSGKGAHFCFTLPFALDRPVSVSSHGS